MVKNYKWFVLPDEIFLDKVEYTTVKGVRLCKSSKKKYIVTEERIANTIEEAVKIWKTI